MRPKVRFQRRVMLQQCTLRSLDRYHFEALHSALLIELEVVAERVLRDIHQLRNLAMGQAMTF